MVVSTAVDVDEDVWTAVCIPISGHNRLSINGETMMVEFSGLGLAEEHLLTRFVNIPGTDGLFVVAMFKGRYESREFV